MLWRTLLCCLALAGAVSAGAWEPGFEYLYEVRKQTTIAQPEVAEVNAGSETNIQLLIIPFSKNDIMVKIVTNVIPSSKAVKKAHVTYDDDGNVKNMYFHKKCTQSEMSLVAQMLNQSALKIESSEKTRMGKRDAYYDVKSFSKPVAGSKVHQLSSGRKFITKSCSSNSCRASEVYSMGCQFLVESFREIVFEGTPKDYTIKSLNITHRATPLQNNKQQMVANASMTLLKKTPNPNPLPRPSQSEENKYTLPEYQAYQPYMKYAGFVSAFRAQTQTDAQFIRESYGWNSTTVYSWANNGQRIGDALGRNIPEFVANLVQNMPTEQPALGASIVIIKHVRTMTVEELLATHKILVKRVQHPQSKRLGELFVNLIALGGTSQTLKTILVFFEKGAIGINQFSNYIFMQRTAMNPSIAYFDIMQKIAVKADKMQHQNQQELISLRKTISLIYTYLLGNAIQGDRRKYEPIRQAAEEFYIPRLERAMNAGDSEEVHWIIASITNIPSKSMTEKMYKLIIAKSSTAGLSSPQFAPFWFNQRQNKIMLKFWLSIFANPTLPHQLRCQAVTNIMQSNPSAWILQHMATLTHNETDPHVRAQVSSAIQSAAQLEGPYNLQLARNARAARPLLKPWVQDASHSTTNFHSYHIGGTGFSYTQLLSYIGSLDSLLPSAFQYVLRKDYNGQRALPWQVSGIVTSINDTFEALQDAFFKAPPSVQIHRDIPTKQFPKIHVERRQKLEGSVNSPGYFAKYFNRAILGNEIAEIFRKFDGHNKQIQVNQINTADEQICVYNNGFGDKVIYSYWLVYFYSINGNIWPQKNLQDANAAMNIKVDTDINLTLKVREESKLGFINTENSMDYITGVDKKMQIQVPLNVSVEVQIAKNFKHINIGGGFRLPKSKSVPIYKYSSKPYVTKIWLLGDQTAVTGHPNTTILHSKPPVTENTKFGVDSTGIVFRMDYSSEIDASYANIFGDKRSWWFRYYRWLVEQYKGYDAFSFISFPFSTRDVHVSSFNVTYDASQSIAHRARFNWRFGEFPTPATIKEASNSQEYGSHPRSVELPEEPETEPQAPAPGTRQLQFQLDARTEGRTTAANFGVDVTVRSNVMNQSISSTANVRCKPAGYKPFNAAFELFYNVPQVSLTNFKQAISESPNSTVEASLKISRPHWEEDAHIWVTGNMGRTAWRKKYILQSPMGKTCLAQMRSGLNLQPACQNVTNLANEMDSYDFKIHYKHIPTEGKRFAYALYSVVRQAHYSEIKEEICDEDPKKQIISVYLDINNQSTAFNFSIQSSLLNANVTDHPIASRARQYIPNAGKSLLDCMGQDIYPLTYAPSFVLDNGHIITLDGLHYRLKPSKCWSIALAFAPKWRADSPMQQEQAYEYKDLSFALTRQTTDNCLESIIKEGNIILRIRGQTQGAAPTVSVNGSVFDLGRGQLRAIGVGSYIYCSPDGQVTVRFHRKSHLDSIHHGSQSVQFTPRYIMKYSTVGSAGNYDGNPLNDLLSPAGCYIRDFGAFQDEWSDCKPSSKESQCDFYSTVHHHYQGESQGINILKANLAHNIFDDSDSSSESSESQEPLLDSPDAKSLLDLGGQLTSYLNLGEGATGVGAQMSLSGGASQSFPQIHHTMMYQTNIKYVPGFKCFAKIPECRPGLTTKVETVVKVKYLCTPDYAVTDTSAEITKSKTFSVRVPVECSDYGYF